MSHESAFPIILSLEVACLALALAAPAGIALAAVQARARYTGRGLVDALVLLPLVLPPSVVGFFLVLVFGRHGLVGAAIENATGVRVLFSPVGAVLASSVVAFPMLVKTAQPAFESVPRDLEEVARTLGLRRVEVFLRVRLRHAWRGVLAGLVLAFARALGEFGATLMVAGNIPGKTNTMPLEIFATYQQGNDARALGYVAVLTVSSLAIAVVAAKLAPREQT